jgi:DNA-binding MarR family transcriptional regulator
LELQTKNEMNRYISILYRQAQRYMNNTLQAHGISQGEYPFLWCIAQGENLNQKQISGQLCVDEALTTRMIRKLEEKGIVTRLRSSFDQRAYQIQLTEKGNALMPVVDQSLSSLGEILTNDMNAKEQAYMVDMLEKMTKKIIHINQK